MKKMSLVLIAAVMALGLSAFTATGKKSFDPVYYQHGGGWVLYTGDICPGSQVDVCIKPTADGDKRLFYNQDPGDPVYRNLP